MGKRTGVHCLLADQIVAGEHWLTCACGEQFFGTDREAVFALYWHHSQSQSRKR